MTCASNRRLKCPCTAATLTNLIIVGREMRLPWDLKLGFLSGEHIVENNYASDNHKKVCRSIQSTRMKDLYDVNADT